MLLGSARPQDRGPDLPGNAWRQQGGWQGSRFPESFHNQVGGWGLKDDAAAYKWADSVGANLRLHAGDWRCRQGLLAGTLQSQARARKVHCGHYWNSQGSPSHTSKPRCQEEPGPHSEVGSRLLIKLLLFPEARGAWLPGEEHHNPSHVGLCDKNA